MVVLAKGDTLQGCRQDSCWSFGLPAFADSVKMATKGQGEFTLTGIFLDNPFPGFRDGNRRERGFARVIFKVPGSDE